MNEFTRGYFALNITKHALNVTGINLCELRNNGLRNPEITVANFSTLLPKPIHHSHHPKLGLIPGYEKISDKKNSFKCGHSKQVALVLRDCTHLD